MTLKFDALRIGLIPITLMLALGALEAEPNKPKLNEPRANEIEKAISNSIPSSALKHLGIGVMAQSLKTGDIIYEKNPDKLLIPASTTKILTAYTALKKLKPTSTFKTQILAKGVIQNGTLIGDIYLKGGGDPSLVSERMWMLVNDFTRSGVQKIEGNVIADGNYFDLEKRPSTRPQYLKDQAYAAPLGALSFNFNTTTIYVRSGGTKGTPPVIISDPENSYVEIVNQATTSAPNTKATITVSRIDSKTGDLGDTVLIRGQMPMGHKELRYFRNISSPSLYTTQMFVDFCKRRGIQIGGRVLEGTAPSDARLLVEFESLPIWQVVWGMNKFSNNFVADQILKKVGADSWGVPGTLTKGLTSVHDALQDIGIPPTSYHVVDGSGLSRETRLTPHQLVKVLSAAATDFTISAEFAASLGIAGEDGTLRRRLPSQATQMIIRGKTGSLDGVDALAGYLSKQDGDNIVFAILLNDPSGKHGRMTGWIDQIAKAISQ